MLADPTPVDVDMLADPTPVDVDMLADPTRCIGHPKCLLSES